MQGAESFDLKNVLSEVSGYLTAEELKVFQRNPSDLLNLLSSKTMTLPATAKLNEMKNNCID